MRFLDQRTSALIRADDPEGRPRFEHSYRRKPSIIVLPQRCADQRSQLLVRKDVRPVFVAQRRRRGRVGAAKRGRRSLFVPTLAAYGAILLAATMIRAVATHILIVGGSALPALALLAAMVAMVAMVWALREQLPPRAE